VGDVLCDIHAANQESAKLAEAEVLKSVTLSEKAVEPPAEVSEWVE